MNKKKNKYQLSLALVLGICLMTLSSVANAQTTVALTWDATNSKILCHASPHDLDTSQNICDDGTMDQVIQWWDNSVVDGFTFITDGDSPTVIAGLAGINYIYEGVSETGLCSMTAGQGVIDMKNKQCTDGTDTVSISFPAGSDGILVGETIKAYKVYLDFYVTNIDDTTNQEVPFAACWLGLNRYTADKAPKDVEGTPYFYSDSSDETLYQEPYDRSLTGTNYEIAKTGVYDASANTCDGWNLDYAYARIVNPQKPVVDLNKFKCYLPYDCLPRQLEIHEERWFEKPLVDTPEDRKTDQNLYYCNIGATNLDYDKYHNQVVAQDYILIGNPSFIADESQSGFKLIFPALATVTTHDTRLTDQIKCHTLLADGVTPKYWRFDPFRGLCIYQAADGTVETLHIYRQEYTLANSERINHFMADIAGGGETLEAIFDMYNGQCAYRAANTDMASQCEAHYRLDLYTQTYKYICDCGQGHKIEYFDDKTNGKYDSWFAFGYEESSWQCENDTEPDYEIIEVDIVDNKCYKGQYELLYDPETHWCGGIPLAVHTFDIIRWDWGTSTAPLPLIDLFNNICKSYNHSEKKINRFQILKDIPFWDASKDKATILNDLFKCYDPETQMGGIEIDLDATNPTKGGTIFGTRFWAANAEYAAGTFTQVEPFLEYTTLWVSDNRAIDSAGNTLANLADASMAWADTAAWEESYRGKLNLDWGIVIHPERGFELWNTYGNWQHALLDGDGTTTGIHANLKPVVLDTEPPQIMVDFTKQTCYSDPYSDASAGNLSNNQADLCDVGPRNGFIQPNIFQVLRPMSMDPTLYKVACGCWAVTEDISLEIGLVTNADITAAAVLIGKKRMHDIYYYDDVMRIDLSHSANVYTEMECQYKGQTLEWSSKLRKCFFKHTPANDIIRAPYQYYYELNVMNYEVINKNFASEADSIYIDFIQNTCQQKGSPYIQELILDSPSSIEAAVGSNDSLDQHEAFASSGQIFCKGYYPDGSFDKKDMQNKKISFLGYPVYVTGSSINYKIDLVTNKCHKYEQNGTLIESADFSLEKQFCYGTFFYPLWWNSFDLDETQTHSYLDTHAEGLIAVLDVKNNLCFIRDQAESCTLSAGNTLVNENTPQEDQYYECDCSTNPSSTKYTFSKKYETNINFVFVGYKFMDLSTSNERDFPGQAPLTDPLDEETLTIYPYKGTAPTLIEKIPCEWEGYETCSLKAADGAITLTLADGSTAPTPNIMVQDYMVNLDYWHLETTMISNSDVKLWLIDFNSMKCYKRGTCEIYSLIIDISTINDGDAATADWRCDRGSESVTELDMMDGTTALFDKMFQDALYLGAADEQVVIDYSTQSCLVEKPDNSEQYARYPFYSRYNICQYGTKFARTKYADVANTLTAVSLEAGTVAQFMPNAPTGVYPNSQFVDWRNGLECITATTGTTSSGTWDGETVGCPGGYNIESDYLKGDALQVIGYAPDQECDDENKSYKLFYDQNGGTAHTCAYRGYLFTFDIATFKCVDDANNFDEVDLRGVDYEISAFPPNILYVADFNLMKCLAPSGNHAHLYYRETLDANGAVTGNIKLCRLLTINGWISFDAKNTNQIVIQGESNVEFGQENLTYYVKLTNLSCWKDAINDAGQNNGGLSLGNFSEEVGMCISNKITTAYIGYNTPIFTGIGDYFTDNNGLEMIYFITEMKDRCVVQSNQNIDECKASLKYNYYGSHYPEVEFTCECTGQDTSVLKFSDNRDTVNTTGKLKIMGTITSRYLTADWYKQMDVNPLLYQCKFGDTVYNYNTHTNSCYHQSDRLFVQRQFYEVFDWQDKSSGKTLIDNFRNNCYDTQDCTPMKFSHYTTWDHDNDANETVPTAEKKFGFCRKVINEDTGFMTRVDDYTEFQLDYKQAGTDFNYPYVLSSIDEYTHQCVSLSGEDEDLYFDPELLTCVNNGREFDYPVSQINSDVTGAAGNLGFSLLKRDTWLTWDTNIAPEILNQYELTSSEETPTIKFGNSVFVAMPAINSCYEIHCPLTTYQFDTTGATIDFTCHSSTQTEYNVGYIRYEKTNSGDIAWKCVSSEVIGTMTNENTYFIGNALKQPSNHCASLDSIYSGRTDIHDYWIHTDLTNKKCMLLHSKKQEIVESTVQADIDLANWDTETEYIPYAYYQKNDYGYNELYGTMIGDIASATPTLSFLGDVYRSEFQTCSNTNLHHFKHTFEVREQTSIYDFVAMKCYIFDAEETTSSNNRSRLQIFDIEPNPEDHDQFRCTVDGSVTPDYVNYDNIVGFEYENSPTDPLSYLDVSFKYITASVLRKQYLITQYNNVNADNSIETNMDTMKIETDYRRNNCQYADQYNVWNPRGEDATDPNNIIKIPVGFYYDSAYNTCGMKYNIDSRRKIPLFDVTNKKAFIDLGTGRCFYDHNISGHLIEFSFDRKKYWAHNYNTSPDRAGQGLEQTFDAYVSTIRCRYYDITDPMNPEFRLEEFTLDQVIVGGLRNYVESPEVRYTTHNDLYLITPVSSNGSIPLFKCIILVDDARMYNPLEPFPINEIPDSTDINWEFYTLINHQCGATLLEDKYYKFVFRDTVSYEVIADVWGDRCHFKDGTIWKLRYDELGRANVCVNPDDEDDKKYISFRFKDFNGQKFPNFDLYSAYRVPQTVRTFKNSIQHAYTPFAITNKDTQVPLRFRVSNYGQTQASPIYSLPTYDPYTDALSKLNANISCLDNTYDLTNSELDPTSAVCLDKTQTPQALINVCAEGYYEDGVPKILQRIFQDSLQVEGAVDLCKKKCYLLTDPDTANDNVRDHTFLINIYDNAGTIFPNLTPARVDKDIYQDWDLVELNEFSLKCRHPTDKTKSIRRYNEQYAFFGDRGSWFSLQETNKFKIRRIELDLTLTTQVVGTRTVWINPTCRVDDSVPCATFGVPGTPAGCVDYVLHYRTTPDNRLCFDQDWWCQGEVNNKIVKYFYSDPDNHFTIQTIDSSDGVDDNDYGFLFPGQMDTTNLINTHPLRHKVLVDVFGGKCYFPATPDNNNKQNHGYDITLDQNVKRIFSAIDNFTQSDVENLYFRCENELFRMHEIYFVGFRNEIQVEKCPKGSYKNPVTGFCNLCKYECDDCESEDRCEDCLDNGPDLTNIYKPCGDRCFKITDLNFNQDATMTAWSALNPIYMVDVTDATCEDQCRWCNDKCATCDAYNDCTDCKDGYVLYDTTTNNQSGGTKVCISINECNDIVGFFADTTVNPRLCSQCDTSCADCITTSTTCTACPSSGTNVLNLDGTCASSCGSGYKDSILDLCLNCHVSCAGCNDGDQNNDCKEVNSQLCANGYFEVTLDDGSKICSNICLNGQFSDPTGHQCLPCDPECSQCESADSKDCIWCPPELTYNEKLDGGTQEETGECITICPDGMFEYKEYMTLFDIEIPNTPTDLAAFTSWQPKQACEYEYENNVIVLSEVPKFCHPCDDTCATCIGPGTEHCSTCAGNLFMREAVLDSSGNVITPKFCSSTCPDGFYPHTQSKKCVECNLDKCLTCEEISNTNQDTTNNARCTTCSWEASDLRYLSNGQCVNECTASQYENNILQTCSACNLSEVSSCQDYSTRAQSCSNVAGKPKLSMLDFTCNNACPTGTVDNGNNVCEICDNPNCDDQVVCDPASNCSTCFEPTKCLTCPSGFMYYEDTWTCVEGTECIEGYAQRIGTTNHCYPCRANESSCNQAGAIKCNNDDPDVQYILKGWPVSYCVLDEAGNQCGDGWYEDDLECKQCSDYCATCEGGKLQCLTCPVGTLNDICFSKTESGKLCLCDLGFEWSVSEDLLQIDIKIAQAVHVDWDYYDQILPSLRPSTINFKDKNDLGEQIRVKYDTKDYEDKTPDSSLYQSSFDEFTAKFIYIDKMTNDEIDAGNAVYYNTKLISESTEAWTTTLSETEWGDQVKGANLIEAIFEPQNWSKFGDYSYTTGYDQANSEKTINIKLGVDHTFNPWTNQLVLRQDVLKREDCSLPYRLIYDNEVEVYELRVPEIRITTDYGGDIDYRAQVPWCSQPEIIVNYDNFPKNVPQFIEWTLFDDLEEHDGEPDLYLLREVNEILADLPPQTSRWTIPAPLMERLVGYRLYLRVKATPFFTNQIAISTIGIDFLNIGNGKLKFKNNFETFRFKRYYNNWTPSMDLEIPPCILNGQSEQQFLASTDFNIAIYPDGQCGQTEVTDKGTYTFDKTRMAFQIPGQTFEAGTNYCVRITAPATVDPNVKLDQYYYDFTLIPEAEFPLIIPTFGTYMEATYGADVDIPFKQIFDPDGTIVNIYSCITGCGKSCDYLFEINSNSSVPRRPVGTFVDANTDNTEKTLRITGDLKEETIYIITIYAKYSKLVAHRDIKVKVLKQGKVAINAAWKVQGINEYYYGIEDSADFTLQFQGIELSQNDQFTWSYETKDNVSATNWSRVPASSTNGDELVYEATQNEFKLNDMRDDLLHRLICDAVVTGQTARYVFEWTTISGIEIEFSITPLEGTTTTLFDFSIDRLTQSNQQFLYIWEYEVGDITGVIGESDLDQYKNFITQPGDENNDNLITITLTVVNNQNGARKQFTQQIQNKVAKVEYTELDGAYSFDQYNGVLVNMGQLTELTFVQTQNVFDLQAKQITQIDVSTETGRYQALQISYAQIDLVSNNIHFSDDLGLEGIDNMVSGFTAADTTVDDTVIGAEPSETLEVTGIRVLDKKQFKDNLRRIEKVQKIYSKFSSEKISELNRVSRAAKRSRLQNFIRVQVAAVLPSLIKGSRFTHTSETMTIHIEKIASPAPDTLSFPAVNTASATATGARRLQETVNDTDMEEEEITLAEKNFACQVDYLLGSSTLSGYPDLAFHAISHNKADMIDMFVPTDSDEELTGDLEKLGTPICDPAEFQLETSTPSGLGTTNIQLVILAAETDQEQFSVCFTIGELIEEEISIRRYDQAQGGWIIEGETDEANTDAEVGKFCQKVGRLGLYAIFEGVNQNSERLYKGFCLYVMFGIDLFLIVGVILGSKLDQKNPSNKTAALPIEGKTGDDDLQKQQDLGDDAKMDDTQKVSLGGQGNIGNKKEPTFGESFKLYHRCINICTSHYHFLKRPSRVFSLALQVAILCNVIGLLTYALDFGSTAAEAVVGYCISFVVLRISNLLFYRSLFWGQEKKGCSRITVIVILAIIYILCHVAAVLVTLNMEDNDFTAWTIAFFVCMVVDLVIWELIVTAWQLGQIRRLRKRQKACCDWQVSYALKNAYI